MRLLLLSILTLLVKLLSSLIATSLAKRTQRTLLLILTLLVSMSQFNTSIGKIEVLMTAFVQLNENMHAVVSPLQRNSSLSHLLLSRDHLGYTVIESSF